MARRTVVLADHTKLGRVSTIHVVPLSMIHTIITDDGASNPQVAQLRASGSQVVVAEVPVYA
jgi:DeoR family fructose operon transcriptional repressor